MSLKRQKRKLPYREFDGDVEFPRWRDRTRREGILTLVLKHKSLSDREMAYLIAVLKVEGNSITCGAVHMSLIEYIFMYSFSERLFTGLLTGVRPVNPNQQVWIHGYQTTLFGSRVEATRVWSDGEYPSNAVESARILSLILREGMVNLDHEVSAPPRGGAEAPYVGPVRGIPDSEVFEALLMEYERSPMVKSANKR